MGFVKHKSTTEIIYKRWCRLRKCGNCVFNKDTCIADADKKAECDELYLNGWRQLWCIDHKATAVLKKMKGNQTTLNEITNIENDK